MSDKYTGAIVLVLKQKYNKFIADGFETYCNNEDFDDETITQDLDEGEEGALIEELLKLFNDNLNPYNKPKPTTTALHILLTSICDGTYAEKRNDIIKPLPDTDVLIPLHSYDTTYTDEDLNYIRELAASQCNDILPPSSKNDRNLLIVLFLGKKHNNLPLLTYLTDSYHRFVMKQPKNADCSTSDWIECCKKNTKSDIYRISMQPNGNKIIHVYTTAINSYCNRMVHCPKLQLMYKINDSIDVIALYILYTYDFISNYLKQEQNIHKLLPAMIDLWIVPKGVQSEAMDTDDDSDDSHDSHDGPEHKANENTEFNINIEERLKYIDKKFILDGIKADQYWRKIQLGLEKLIHERNQRLCIILDREPKIQISKHADKEKKSKPKIFNRKQNKDMDDDKKDNPKKKGDRMYMYHLNKNLNASSFEKYGNLLCPSLISNTKHCILPDIKYRGEPLTKNVYKWQHIGAFHGINGYQFTLSFHIYEESDVRVYLYHNSCMVRFVPSDVITLLPKFFKNPHYKGDGAEIKKLVQKVMNNEALNDKRFTKFYESLTGSSLLDEI